MNPLIACTLVCLGMFAGAVARSAEEEFRENGGVPYSTVIPLGAAVVFFALWFFTR